MMRTGELGMISATRNRSWSIPHVTRAMRRLADAAVSAGRAGRIEILNRPNWKADMLSVRSGIRLLAWCQPVMRMSLRRPAKRLPRHYSLPWENRTFA